MMYHVSRHFAAAAVIGLCMIPATAARAEDQDRNDKANRHVITNLDSNLKGAAAVQDTVLQNSWGVAFSPAGSPFWINDNATGCSTLYDGDGTIVSLQVNIPLPGNVVPASDCKTVNPKSPPKPTPAAPTGIIWNPSSAFVVPGTQLQAAFIFDTEDGTISAWAPGLTPLTTRSSPSTIRKSRMPQTAPSTKVSHSASTSTERFFSPPTSASGRSTCSGRQPLLAAYSQPRRRTEASLIRTSRPALPRSASKISMAICL
jgi:hypothetical protein